ncbi:hypothetical protein NL676_015499 [Syzygium grande]|nr:hypothetical protein NL676_015499 [Syzygium grande]
MSDPNLYPQGCPKELEQLPTIRYDGTVTVSEKRECVFVWFIKKKRKKKQLLRRERERKRVLCGSQVCELVSSIVQCKLESFFLLNSSDRREFGLLEELLARSVAYTLTDTGFRGSLFFLFALSVIMKGLLQ